MSNLLSVPSWDELDLVRLLDEPFRDRLCSVYQHVEPLLQTRPFGAEEFTDHDLKHSARIVERIGHILPEEVILNESELYILLLAALLHDAGLWTRKEEALDLLKSDSFRQSLVGSDAVDLLTVDQLMDSPSQRWMGELILQRLVVQYHRQNHPERLCTSVLSKDKAIGQELRILMGDDFVEPVTTVAVAHSWPGERVLDDNSLRPIRRGNDVVCMRFVAQLLRLGDLLDLGDGRVSSLLWSYLAPLNSVSEAHWRKEAALKLNFLGPDNIRISGRFDIDQEGIQAAEAFRLALDWLQMLRSEINGVALVWNSRREPEAKKRLWFGRLELDDKDVKANGLTLNDRVSFELDRSRILTLLRDELYAEPGAFVRELVQNSVDATRVQMIRDRRDGIWPDIQTGDDEPWNWPDSVTADDRYEIAVECERLNHKEVPCIIFSVADKGIGMSLGDIRQHFLQVGKSYYTTDKYRQEFSHRPISQFGIGFLSCLTAAEHIEIVTRQRGEPDGLRLVVQPPSEHFIITKETNANFGTRVLLRIRQDRVDDLKSRYVPFDGIDLYSDPNSMDETLISLAKGWGAFIEFAIRTPKGRAEPRRPTTFIPHFVNKDGEIDSVPVRVTAANGKEISVGRVFYHVVSPARLPVFASIQPPTSTLASIRGISLSATTYFNASKQVHVVLDFRRIPPRTFTAGRTLAQGGHFISSIGERVSHVLRKLTIDRLAGRGPELLAIWQLFLDRHLPRSGASENLPVREGENVEWMRWSEIEARYARILLVPFHVAWKGPWSYRLPCAGIPNEQLNSIRFSSDKPYGPIYECALISVPDLCTAYLWPPDSTASDLDLLREQFTYCHTGLVGWPSDNKPHCLIGAAQIDSRFVKAEELPSYDRSYDPWHFRGFDRYGHFDDGTETGRDAKAILEAANEFSLTNGWIDIVIDKADGWS